MGLGSKAQQGELPDKKAISQASAQVASHMAEILHRPGSQCVLQFPREPRATQSVTQLGTQPGTFYEGQMAGLHVLSVLWGGPMRVSEAGLRLREPEEGWSSTWACR
jgi:hypothetical protein